jgi:phosphoglycolate phosphatase-like HAD superfamily hydrolase
MRKAGLDRYVDVGGFGEESAVRSHLVPVALRKASERAGHEIAPSAAVVIGDTPLDVEAGRAHGTRTVGVATGPYSVAELEAAGADLALPSLADAEAVVGALLALTGRAG